MKSSISRQLCRTAIVAALALILPHAARAQTQLLVNTNFDSQKTGWTTVGNANAIGAGATYYNAGVCAKDATAETVNILNGDPYVANSYGNFSSNPNYTFWNQSFAATPGSTWTAGAWAYASHEDLSGPNNFYFEVDFYNITGTVLATYESYNVINLECSMTNPPASGSWPFPLDTWNYLAVTNEMSGTNTGSTVIGNTGTNGVFTAPAGTASIKFQATFANIGSAGGSIYFDDTALWQLSGALPPALSAINPNGVILCTNTTLSCTATSPTGTITNVEVIAVTKPLGGTAYTTNTTNLSSPAVTGLGTGTANIAYPLTPNLIYSVTVAATDNAGNVASTSASFDTIAPALVIEAEDFNFNGGQYTNTPPDGGLAVFVQSGPVVNGGLGEQGIDENKNPAGTSGESYYRPTDLVIIQGAAPTTGTAQKYVTAAANGDTVDIPLEVGYNSLGDWLDYTRTFGSDPSNSAPAGTYYVWANLATDGGGAALNFYQITSNPMQGTETSYPNQGDQTSNLLGSFSFTDNNWNGFDYVPMVDQFGNLVSVTLSGTETFRGTVTGNPNIDFYMLVPAVPILTPKLEFAYPDGLHPFEPTNSFTFTIGPANGSNILSSGIDVVLNGVDVTSSPKFTLTASGSDWKGSYPVASNAVYAAVVSATNTAGLSSSFAINFDTFDVNNYQWECVDYDFSTNGTTGGLFIDNPVPTCDTTTPQTGEEATNSYFGYPAALVPEAVALQGVDINWVDGQPAANDYYRNDGVGSQPASDYVRPKFLAAQAEFSDPNIGPMNIGWYNQFNWLNYTRHFPTNSYNIYARLAGGAGAFSGTQLSMVTSGYGTSLQTSNILGTFSDPLATGWQAWHWIPLLDTNGAVVVVPLGGQATLTLMSGNNLNAEFLMLVPAPAQLKLTPSIVSGQLNLSFTTEVGHNYSIVFKSDLTLPTWTQVGPSIPGTGGTTNVTESLSGTQGYYTVGVQ
jgi:hypothetical protein